MLTRAEFFAQFQIGINCLDGTPQYTHNKQARNEMYKDYVKEQQVHTHTLTPNNWNDLVLYGSTTVMPNNSLAPMPSAQCQPPTASGFNWKHKVVEAVRNQEEGINPMNYASASISTPATETQDQRKYLAQRLESVYCDKRDPLESEFGLVDDDAPQSLTELKARIADGKFTFREEKDIRPYFYWTEMLRWRDPAKKADQEGFDAAKKALKAERQKALDIIKIDEPKAGLEAIKALEAWTPTGVAN